MRLFFQEINYNIYIIKIKCNIKYEYLKAFSGKNLNCKIKHFRKKICSPS